MACLNCCRDEDNPIYGYQSEYGFSTRFELKYLMSSVTSYVTRFAKVVA